MLFSTSPHLQINMQRHLIILLGSIISAILLHLYILYSEGYIYADIKTTGILFCIALMILTTYIMSFVLGQIDRFIKWNNYPISRFIIGITVHSILLFTTFYCFYSDYWHALVFEIPDGNLFNQVTLLRLSIVLFIMTFLFYVIQYATISYRSFTYTQIKETQLKREMVDAQFDALKSQLQPHFLFNSLNTISSLIHKDEEIAESFIRKLAKTYDYSLSNYHEQWVSLKEELEFVKSFVDMMKIRFGNHLRLVIDVKETDLSKKIMPLSLQLLAENAIKHNVIDVDEPLNINVLSSENDIKVFNNKTTKPTSITSHKIGLSNLHKRYSLWSEASIVIKETEDTFSVQIPIH